MYRAVGKRALDLLISIAALVLLSPLLLAVAALVAIFLGQPVIFRQTREGYHRQTFTIYKFRSMLPEFDASGRQLSETERMTTLGRILRATSFDELPELYNVLRGDMSLVGPRPLIMRYKPWYAAHETRRFDVRPGITGWAQINGRNLLGWDERFLHDVYYVDHLGFLLDLKILLLTVGKVVLRQGVEVDTSLNVPSLDDERREKWGHPPAIKED
jgi:lipopolysaccharide/colanic/teichoic acid biosynthesis glycosyltransferase